VSLSPEKVLNTIAQTVDLQDAKLNEIEVENGYALVSIRHQLGGEQYYGIYVEVTEQGTRIDVGLILKIPFKGLMDPADYIVKLTPKQQAKMDAQGEQLVRKCLVHADGDVSYAHVAKAMKEQQTETKKLQKEVKKARRDAGCLGCLWLASCFVVALGMGAYAIRI
jgi:hypothetical protein